MTNDETMRVLAERDGWTRGDIEVPSFEDSSKKVKRERWFSPIGYPSSVPPNYLESRDALFPVLEKLTVDEWRNLLGLLSTILPFGSETNPCYPLRKFATMPPQTLAPLVARAIVEAKGT